MASPLTPFFITGYSKGLQTNKKPFLLPDQAWAVLYNAYCWRERIQKREGLKLLGRLRRVFTGEPLGSASSTLIIQFSLESSAQIEPGSVVITDAALTTFTDNGLGVLVSSGAGSGTINYATTAYVVTGSVGALTISFNYFPGLPVMGIHIRDIAAINAEQTIWWDTVYAYIWNGAGFEEFIPGTVWSGTNSDFFWAYNYRGASDADRLFFATNFVNDAANPIRYTDGLTWTTFAPLISATDTLYQARIIIAYYGRLLALNTYEGTTAGLPAGAVNYFNRCRFSQLGSPIAADAWRQDIFGKGGFLDAPTNEAIIGATFIKNTLVVTFEQTTWQLRYVGEYGLPFIWERVSADFGSESTFSSVLFDNNMLAVGDVAIIAANGIGADRIDLDIPDQIFNFKNANEGVKRVWGIRDYQKELVYWNYPDAETEAAPGVEITFPNKVLVYNYRNNTFAIFRDNVTAFGLFQFTNNYTWNRIDIFWDDTEVTWDDVDSQSRFPGIVIGNQRGYVSLYGYTTPDEVSLPVDAISLTGPVQLTIANHNLQDGEIIYLTGALFVDAVFAPLATTLNDTIYQVAVVDANTVTLFKYDFTTNAFVDNFTFTPIAAGTTYIGGGQIALFPRLNVVSKDINLYQNKGMQTKLSFIDFLMAASTSAAMTVKLFLNSSTAVEGNLTVGNKNMSTALTPSFYPPASDYAWFRFYATLSAQYFNINITYSDALMATLATHQQVWTLYAINAFCKPGGRNLI